jgi:hypothetical protein
MPSAKWDSLSIESGEVRGFDDKMASMLFVVAKKATDGSQGIIM